MASATAPLPLIRNSMLVTWLDKTELPVVTSPGRTSPRRVTVWRSLPTVKSRRGLHHQHAVGQHVHHAAGEIELQAGTHGRRTLAVERGGRVGVEKILQGIAGMQIAEQGADGGLSAELPRRVVFTAGRRGDGIDQLNGDQIPRPARLVVRSQAIERRRGSPKASGGNGLFDGGGFHFGKIILQRTVRGVARLVRVFVAAGKKRRRGSKQQRAGQQDRQRLECGAQARFDFSVFRNNGHKRETP